MQQGAAYQPAGYHPLRHIASKVQHNLADAFDIVFQRLRGRLCVCLGDFADSPQEIDHMLRRCGCHVWCEHPAGVRSGPGSNSGNTPYIWIDMWFRS